ncbi:MAG: Mannosyl-D-glycerate transport/metabolism system repressor MngR [Lentisphaerae bacterium ADurb.Bin242]|nr:MAG: Mannosyl-D-glycerate transport/metabolism system repressor MngR [Lentisphaerae bacterium ADurb.Bin242]
MDLRAEKVNSKEIASRIRREIATGRLVPGEKLVGTRLLAEKFNVGRQILRSAFDLLEEECVLESIPGAGTFVRRNLPRELNIRQKLSVGLVNWRQDVLGSFTVRVHHTLLAQTEDKNCRIHFCMANTHEKLAAWMDELSIDGLILTGKVDDALVLFLKSRSVPFLLLGNFELKEEACRLEKDVYSILYNTLNTLYEQHPFRRIVAVTGRKTILGTRQAIEAMTRVIDEKKLTGKKAFFTEYAEISDYEKLTAFLDGKRLGPTDLLYLSADAFHAAARYIFERGIRKEDRPFLFLDMPVESVPYPDIVGCFLYKKDALAEQALDAFLNVYYGRVPIPWRGECVCEPQFIIKQSGGSAK